MSRVLLTGATGFVGRHTLATLSDAGHEVHALARPREPALDGVERDGVERDGVTRGRVSWHELDLLDGREVRELVAAVQPEILVHLAWYAEHGSFWSSPENVRWVQASLELLRAFAAASGRRAVVAGSCAEYEWLRDVYPEAAPLAPATLYGAAKHGLHTVAAAYAEQAGVSLAWGRLFFMYGPHEDPRRFVPSIVVPLLRGEPARMTAGTQRRDFLHAADAGAAFAALADSELEGAINIASGEGVELRELAERIAERTAGRELLQIGARPMPAGEPPALIADVGRLRDELGWSPRIGLDEGLDGVIAWWRRRAPARGTVGP